MRTRPWTIRKRRLAGLMAVVMLLLPLSLPIGAEDAAPALPARIVAEDTAQRGINSKTFTLSDGTYLAVAYPEAVHYQTQSGFAAIDNSFVPAVLVGDAMTGQIRRTDDLAAAQAAPAVSGTAYWANRDNPFSVALPQRLDARAPVVLRHGRHTLRFAAEVAANTAVWSVPEAAEDANAADSIDLTDPAQVRAANDRDMAAPNACAAVSFPGAWANADLHYAVAGQKLKESILLHDVPQQSDFSFLFAYDTDILRAEVQEDGSVCLTDNEGETAFFIEAPAMFDSDEGYTNAVAVTVEELNGGCRYTLTPDRAWLTDSARVYPVTLEPSVKTTQSTHYIHDNGVQQSDPNTNYITSDRIYIGSSSSGKEGRMYIKLTQWPTATGLNAGSISAAFMNLQLYRKASYQTGNDFAINTYLVSGAWDTSTITWNKQPSLTSGQIGSTDIRDLRGATAGYSQFNVLKWVQAHYSSPSSDNGICLKPNTVSAAKGRVCYISSDYAASESLHPIIEIYYTGTAGQAWNITNGGYYRLRNHYSGKYPFVNSSISSGSLITQHPITNGAIDEVFRLDYISDGYYSIKSAKNTSLCVTVPQNKDQEDLKWQFAPYTGASGQKFRILTNGDGTYHIRPACSGTRAMYVEGTDTSTGDAIGMRTWHHGAWRMQWYMDKAIYGCGGAYRQVDTTVPNCFGYAMLHDDKVEFHAHNNSTQANLFYFNKTLLEIAEQGVISGYRRIDDYLSPIDIDEYRIAVRMPGAHNEEAAGNYHVIYQLSDGTWAGKNGEARSKHFGMGDPSSTPAMWDGDEIYPASCGTVFYAIKKY